VWPPPATLEEQTFSHHPGLYFRHFLTFPCCGMTQTTIHPKHADRIAVLQSFRTVAVPPWITACMDSVRQWTLSQGWEYLILDDHFLKLAPDWVRQCCGRNIYAITDIARLIWAHDVLSSAYERVIWVDADVVIFNPEAFARQVKTIQDHGFARELFLRVSGRLTTPKWSLNNAVMVFDHNTQVLGDYLRRCLDELARFRDCEVPRTAMGPILLEQLDATQHLNRIDGVGLFTPAMLEPFAAGQDALMRTYLSYCAVPPSAANLCHFIRNATAAEQRLTLDQVYAKAIDRLIHMGLPFDRSQDSQTQPP